MKALVVLSGGMDSTTALAQALNKKIEVLGVIHFQYGSKHNPQEEKALNLICDHYKIKTKIVVDLDFVKDLFKSDLLTTGGKIPEGHYAHPSMKKTVVPFRNGIMLSISAGVAESIGAKAVILGNHFGDHAIYPDCRKSFIEPMGKAIKAGTYGKIKVMSPFLSKTKTQIAKLGSKLNVPYELTYSCYKGGEKHCGKCGTCVERKEAFNDSKLKDPTVYEE